MREGTLAQVHRMYTERYIAQGDEPRSSSSRACPTRDRWHPRKGWRLVDRSRHRIPTFACDTRPGTHGKERASPPVQGFTVSATNIPGSRGDECLKTRGWVAEDRRGHDELLVRRPGFEVLRREVCWEADPI